MATSKSPFSFVMELKRKFTIALIILTSFAFGFQAPFSIDYIVDNFIEEPETCESKRCLKLEKKILRLIEKQKEEQ